MRSQCVTMHFWQWEVLCLDSWDWISLYEQSSSFWTTTSLLDRKSEDREKLLCKDLDWYPGRDIISRITTVKTVRIGFMRTWRWEKCEMEGGREKGRVRERQRQTEKGYADSCYSPVQNSCDKQMSVFQQGIKRKRIKTHLSQNVHSCWTRLLKVIHYNPIPLMENVVKSPCLANLSSQKSWCVDQIKGH